MIDDFSKAYWRAAKSGQFVTMPKKPAL